ncbi:hypothetical protein [Mycobacterium marseillense]|uniref:hypothetical protein n=1 Tax=Mycobacterium marseillense TaxID=701042 RepID=UPI0011A0C5A0|nr:hypothetical protein [Mycobacterium marseillense]
MRPVAADDGLIFAIEEAVEDVLDGVNAAGAIGFGRLVVTVHAALRVHGVAGDGRCLAVWRSECRRIIVEADVPDTPAVRTLFTVNREKTGGDVRGFGGAAPAATGGSCGRRRGRA